MTEERRAEIEHEIAQNADARAEIAAYRQQVEALHALYDPVLGEPIPDRMSSDTIQRRLAARTRRRAAQLVAAVILVLIGSAGGWYLRPLQAPPNTEMTMSLADEALLAHRVYTAERRHAVEVPASDEAHLVRWLSARLETELRTPDLKDAGYYFIGGRLLPSPEGPAAQFMYEDDTGERLTLYIRPDPGTEETRFEYVSEDGVGAFYWVEGRFGYALIGAQPRDPLLRAARLVYLGLSEE